MGCLTTTCAIAASATISWSLPTQNVDGSNIPTTGSGSIDYTRVQIGTCENGGFGQTIGEVIVPAPSTSTSIADIEPGTYCFRAFAGNTYGIESASSNVASKIFDAVVPKPPVLKSIVGATAYTIRKQNDGEYRIARDVGIVTTRIDCGEVMVAPNYALIPSTAVSFYRKRIPDVVVTSCIS